MANKMNLALYEKVINIIYDEHIKATRQWLEDKVNQEINIYNLRKSCICDICNVKGIILPEFKNYIASYKKDTLISLDFEILVRIHKKCNIFINGRVKNEDSIINKINKKFKQDSGKFSINKCLNDLIGFRIIDSDYDNNIYSLIGYLDKIKDKCRIRHMKRVNGQYEGYHIYFKGIDNCYFPAELQVWSAKHETINLESHKIYKKEYVDWPQKYKNYFEGSE